MVMLDYSKIFFLFWLENLPSSPKTCWKNTNHDSFTHTHTKSETDDSHDHEKIDDIGNDHADDDNLKIKPPVSLKLKLIQVGKTVQS